MLVEALEFPRLFSEAECENFKNVLIAQAESELVTANLKAENKTWLQTLNSLTQITKLFNYIKK